MRAAEYGELADGLHDALVADGVVAEGDTRAALSVGLQFGMAVVPALTTTADALSSIGIRISAAELISIVTNNRGC